jgi:hypothetical protein
MFSDLVFTPVPRQTEEIDARMAIRRQEPDYERPKRGRKESARDEHSGSYDMATVSVEALQAFLENFVEAQEKKAAIAEEAPLIHAPLPPSEQAMQPQESSAKPHDTAAAKAAGLYRSSARRVPSAAASEGLPIRNTQSPHMDIGPEDIRTIHSLLTDLKDLSARGVQFLTIMQEESFLQSLTGAVDRIRHPEHYR